MNIEPKNTDFPIFPFSALPSTVADMCLAVAEHMQVPLELPSTVALGVLAACCQKKTVVRIGADYIEPLNLFTLAIAQSGERKSPVFRALTDPVYTAQDEYFTEHRDEIMRSQREYSLLNKQLEEFERKYTKDDGGEALAGQIHKLDAKLRDYNVLTAPKLLLDDVTSEKLIDVLDEQGGSVTIASAEGGLFISLKNKAAMNATFDVYLKAYSGDSIDVKRIGREGNSIKNPRLSLVLTCQTDVARNMINNPTFREKGLPARFLYAMCRSNLGKRAVDMPDIPTHIKDKYETLIRSLLSCTLDEDSPDRELTLSEDSRKAYQDYARRIEPRLAADGSYNSMTDWGAKLVGQMLRIAGIIAVCEGCCEIDAHIICRAAEIAEWFAGNASALFTKKGFVSDTQYLLDVIVKAKEKKPDAEITKRDLARRTHHKKGFNLDKALLDLEKLGYIRVETDNRKQIIFLNALNDGDNGDIAL